MRAKVLITIDTEPDNMWEPASKDNPAFRNIAELDKLQKVFDDFKVKPTYLVTFSVAKSREVSVLKDIIRSGALCEIGTHLHAAETLPYQRHLKGDGSFLHQYSKEAQRQKLDSIDKLIADTFGRKPVSYRGGRWSLDEEAVSHLVEFGYCVDSSVTPFISWENYGGCNFKKRPNEARFIANGKERGLLEIPISVKIKTRFQGSAKFIYLNTPNWTHAQGLLRRLTGFNILTLDPSYNTSEDMQWLCDSVLEDEGYYLNIAFHSSAIISGGTPYTMTEESVKIFFERLEKLLDYLIKVRGFESLTLKEFYNYRKDILN